MAWPEGITTRTVNFGPAVSLERGEGLTIKISVKASRRLVWAATGTPLIPEGANVTGDQVEASLELPVTDQPGYVDGKGGSIDVADGKNSHYYTATIEYLRGKQRVSTLNVNPFTVPTGDGSPIDLDLLLPATTGGVTVSVPDTWSATLAQAQAAADEAASTLAAAKWQPATLYAAGAVTQAPDGSTVRRLTEGTSGTVFDAAEQAAWEAVAAAADTVAGQALTATFARLDPTTGAVLDGDGQPVEGAGDAEVAALLSTDGTASRTAVEGVVADAPTVTAAAAAAVDDELATRDLLEAPEESDAGVLVSVRDADDHRTWLEANAEDGGPTAYAATLIADSLGVAPPVTTTTYVASGDSMTSDAYGGGTSYPTKLAALLNQAVINNGSGGRRASEVAVASGALAFPIAVPGGSIPATTDPVACTPTFTDPGPGSDRTFNVTVQGVACSLVYTFSTTSWTLARKVAAGSPTPVPKTGAVAVPATAYGNTGHVHILWGGRNNVPKNTATDPMIAAAQWCKDNGLPFLLVSVCNTTTETSGTSGYDDIIALNAEFRNAFPREYVELRGRLIVQGLDLAGLTATGTDTTDIANDCIPSSLLADGLHPNDAGRVAVAAIIHDELTIRGLA